MQEIDNGMARSGRVDQAAILADTGGWCLFRVPALSRDEGTYGHVLLSQAPITGEIIRLPGRGEPRMVFLGTTTGLSVASTHLSCDPVTAQAQLAAIMQLLHELPSPRVVLGDLNHDPGARALSGHGFRPAARMRTFPRATPYRRIDHILIQSDLRTIRATTPRVPISDHRPLHAALAAT